MRPPTLLTGFPSFRLLLSGHHAWVAKSLLIGALGSILDYSVVGLGVTVLALQPSRATALGLGCGMVLNFLLNRRFTFNAGKEPVLAQALRYALAMGALLVVHSCVVAILCGQFKVPVLLAKLAADLGVLSFSQPFALRRFVFPRRPLAAERHPALPVATQSAGA